METIHAGEHNVQYNRIKGRRLRLLQTFDAICGDINCVSLTCQTAA